MTGFVGYRVFGAGRAVAPLLLTLMLGGCSGLGAFGADLWGVAGSASTAPATASPAATAPVRAPLIAALRQMDGLDLPVLIGQQLVVTELGSEATGWSASIDAPDLVRFVPNASDGLKSIYPGFTVLAPGSANITLTNAVAHRSVHFRLQGVEPDSLGRARQTPVATATTPAPSSPPTLTPTDGGVRFSQ